MIVCQTGEPVSTLWAFTVTFLAIRSFARPSSPSAGRKVWNFVLVLASLPGG